MIRLTKWIRLTKDNMKMDTKKEKNRIGINESKGKRKQWQDLK